MNDQNTQTALAKMQEHYARLYFHLAAEYLRTFGERGEEALRESIRELGKDRGKTTREEHQRLGYPINLYTLFTAGDFPSKAGFRCDQIELQPDHRISETLHCPLCEWWRKFGGLKEGILYCEEIYAAMWSAYHPEIKTNQAKIMSRGDSVCRFEVHMPSEVGRPENEGIEIPSPEARLHRMLEIWSKMFYYLARGLIKSVETEGEAAVRRAIRRFGRERGELMRQGHLDEGYEINIENLLAYYDLPIDVGFDNRIVESGPDVSRNEIFVCKYHDVWKTYPDGNDISKIYCEEIHHQIFGAYDPATQINLATTLTRRDECCRFAIYLRPANRIPEPTWVKAYEDQKEN